MTSTLGIKKIQYPNGTNVATLDSSGSIAFAGDLTIPQKIIHSGDTDTHITLADNQIDLTAGNVNIFQGVSNEVVINQGGADVNFRVEGDTDASLLIVDAGEDNVKIGSSAGNYGKFSIRNEAAGAQERGLYVEVAPASGTSPNNVAVFSAANGNLTTPVVRIHHESPTADQLLIQATTTGSNTVKFSVDEDGDIYSAGGINLGGTGSANQLDDYEEGTWTPSHGGNTSYHARHGAYIKVGKKVFVRGQVHVNAIGTGSVANMTGLPFTAATTTNGSPAGTNNVSYYAGLATAVIFIAGYVPSGTTSIYTIANRNSNYTTIQYNTGTFFANGTRLDFSMTYETT